MPARSSASQFISEKIAAMKEANPTLRSHSDDYVFSALCVKANFYKNPALILNESDYEEIIVDGPYDGGVDILLSDPNSEGADLVIGQSKYYRKISSEDIRNSMIKMAVFYKNMVRGQFDDINEKVQRRFSSLYSEVGEESKIRFVFYTSAAQGRINPERIIKEFREQFSDNSQIEVSILFASDIEEEIKESESRRPTVESGKIAIDRPGNCLRYGDKAVIVNVSAFSIKRLYAQHNTNLLARNLRYHVAGGAIDKAIRDTITNAHERFWMKNNGITIVCEDFAVDGKEVKLTNFSIVNGGQTSFQLHKSKQISESYDFYLPCKIIMISGETEDEKNQFSLEISKATNSQKAIKAADLKANSPEQLRFAQAMREVGVFYETKRGEAVPKAYRELYLNSKLVEIGKLCLAGVFQLPCTSRSKPSTLYNEKYYEPVFNGNQLQVARICKELLYIDYYFRRVFQNEFDRENRDMPDSNLRIAFAHNARTMCISFVALAARYHQGNISVRDLDTVCKTVKDDGTSEQAYEIFRNLGDIQYLFPPNVFNNKDQYDAILKKLFYAIIDNGIVSFEIELDHNPALTAANYLKKDKNYIQILKYHWRKLQNEIDDAFKGI